MTHRRNRIIVYIALCLALVTAVYAHASTTSGTIDPNNQGHFLAKLYSNSGIGNQEINFGRFTTQTSDNISISDAGIRGFAWGQATGWIVMNCVDTTSGCSTSNGNFKVSVNSSGVLSGYAWGENAGWINFGPFQNSNTSQVKILSNGKFGGTNGLVGYAWSQNFGWIVFNCTDSNSCVETDYRPADSRSSGGGGGGGGGGGSPTPAPQCSDGIDNDGDGKIDYLADPGCTDPTDNDETDPILPPPPPLPQCSDGIDNDHDGKVDYPADPGCSSPNDNDETDPKTPPPPIAKAACEDGIDNDGDGKIDYPADPGCSSPTDNDETDTIVPLPACSDGIDNDGDGKIDYPADPGCSSPTDDSEQDAVVYPPFDSTPQVKTPPPIDRGGSSGIHIFKAIPSLIKTVERSFTTTVENRPDVGNLGDEIISVVTEHPAATTAAGLSGLLAFLIANQYRLLQLLLWMFGFARKRKKWGTVYDSVTKYPLDPAYVAALDINGKTVAESITDLDGRYGFLLPPGTYRLIANKTNYSFPSERLRLLHGDEVYSDLYFGDVITIEREEQAIIKNIPMDPLAEDWNEAEKRRRHLGTYSEHIKWKRLLGVLFYAGFAVSLISFIVTFAWWHLAVLLLYTALFATGVVGSSAGSVIRNAVSGAPIPFAVISFFSLADATNPIMKKVASPEGRFFALLPNGKYRYTVHTKNNDGSYALSYEGKPFAVRTGIVNKKIYI